MIFNSLEFAAFLPIVLSLYYATNRAHRNWVLLAAGYVFYGAWDVRFLCLVSLSTVLDYCTGLMIGKGTMSLRQRLMPTAHVVTFVLVFLLLDWRALQLDAASGPAIDWGRLLTPTPLGVRVLLAVVVLVGIAHAAYPRLAALPEATRKRFFLRCSLFGQLGMLAIFKYYNFFVSSAEALASRTGLDASRLHLDIVLPVGISFYTFQTISYVCDVYWGRMKPVERLRDFALFVSYFPPLVAGPIERASHLVPRLLADRKVTFDDFALGASLILFGLFKKIAIADGLAPAVDSVFNAPATASWLDVVGGTLAFTAQIYCDFSGYSDIATGVSLFFGIELLKNFDLPYFSVNPSEFWRRWHISLSTWLRDYLYVPLGGNRGGERRTYLNLLLTMVLGGLWHGAAWNFVLWGAYQGLLLALHRMVTGAKAAAFAGGVLERLPRAAFFMLFAGYGWLLFRAGSLADVTVLTRTLFAGPFDARLTMIMPPATAVLALAVLVLYELVQLTAGPVPQRRLTPALRGGLYAALTILVLMGTSHASQQFIYFQF